MEDSARWTLEELVRRAALALADSASTGGYAGAPNGRVRERPDQRLIRWYTSIGLVDRPFGGRGRGARYGERHLRQLVAVKRLQAQGLPLAEIQVRLAALPDDELALLAPMPPEALAPAEAPTLRIDVGRDSNRFWAVEYTGGAFPAEHGSPPERVPAPAAPAPAPAPAPAAEAVPGVRPLAGVQLAPGVLLVLPVAPTTGDLAALAAAARPLLAALADRGLLPATASIAEPTEGVPR